MYYIYTFWYVLVHFLESLIKVDGGSITVTHAMSAGRYESSEKVGR
jgi:hypothetical protein